MLPSMARVTLIWCETSLRVSCAVGSTSWASTTSTASSLSIRVSSDSLAATRSSMAASELLKNLVAQQRPQDRFVASRESRDNHLESGARTLDKMRWIKARIGPANSAEPSAIASAEGLVIGWPRGSACRVQQGCYVVGRGWRGARVERGRGGAHFPSDGRERCAAAAPETRRPSQTR